MADTSSSGKVVAKLTMVAPIPVPAFDGCFRRLYIRESAGRAPRHALRIMVRSRMFAPRIFPTDSADCFFTMAVTVVTPAGCAGFLCLSSGNITKALAAAAGL